MSCGYCLYGGTRLLIKQQQRSLVLHVPCPCRNFLQKALRDDDSLIERALRADGTATTDSGAHAGRHETFLAKVKV